MKEIAITLSEDAAVILMEILASLQKADYFDKAQMRGSVNELVCASAEAAIEKHIDYIFADDYLERLDGAYRRLFAAINEMTAPSAPSSSDS